MEERQGGNRCRGMVGEDDSDAEVGSWVRDERGAGGWAMAAIGGRVGEGCPWEL